MDKSSNIDNQSDTNHVKRFSSVKIQKTIVASTSIRVLEDQLVNAVQFAKTTNSVEPIIVIVGSQLQRVYLRRLLARRLGSFANVRFYSLTDIVEELTPTYPNKTFQGKLCSDNKLNKKPVPADKKGTELAKHLDTLQVRRTLTHPTIFEKQNNLLNRPPYLKQFTHVPLLEHIISIEKQRENYSGNLSISSMNLAETLAPTIRELRESGIDIKLIETGSKRPWLRDLSRVATIFQNILSLFTDSTENIQETLSVSSNKLVNSLTYGTLPINSLLIYGIYDLNAMQLQLINHLTKRTPTQIFLTMDQNSETFGTGRKTLIKLQKQGFKLNLVDTKNSGNQRSARFVFSASSPSAEIEEIVRRIMEDINDGIHPPEIAIIHRKNQDFEELIGSVLDRACLPFYRSSGYTARQSLIGRTALLVIDLLYDEPTRATLFEFLSVPDIDLTWIRKEIKAQPVLWEGLSKEIGLIKGWQEFDLSLQLYKEHLDQTNLTEANSEKIKIAEELHVVIKALSKCAVTVTRTVSWRDHTSYFLKILNQVIPWAVKSDVLTIINEHVENLANLDQIPLEFHSNPVTRGTFRRAVETIIKQSKISSGKFQKSGIFLGNAMSSRFLRFKRVYIASCSERIFPPLIRQDPLLLDAEREQINQNSSSLTFLPIKGERLKEERLLFELACQSGIERVTFSYPRRSNNSSSSQLPSILLLEELSDLVGGFLSATSLEHQPRSWFKHLPHRTSFYGSSGRDALRAIDDSDLRLHILEHGNQQATSVIKSLWPTLPRVRIHKKALVDSRFGVFDGIVPAKLIESVGVLKHDLTATSLTNYTDCPYRFFLSDVLKIKNQSEPEQTLEIAAIHRGIIVHAILDDIVQDFLFQKISWTSFTKNAETSIHKAIDQRFKHIPLGATGLPISWQLFHNRVVSELKTYFNLEHSTNNPLHPTNKPFESGTSWQPFATEKFFKGVPIYGGERRLTFSGRIDRLDKCSSGMIRVIDYKTGVTVREIETGYRTGGSLQLPIYLYAAAHLEGISMSLCNAEYHYISDHTDYRRLTLNGKDLAKDNRFSEVLAAITDGINSGYFFYNPGIDRKNCRLCDFTDICHVRVEDLSNRKLHKSRDITNSFKSIRGK